MTTFERVRARLRSGIGFGAAASCAALLCAAAPAASAAHAPAHASAAAAPADCAGQYKIDKRFPNGARWQICWEARDGEGLRMLNVRYTPKGSGEVKVLRDLALTQVHVPYDDDSQRHLDMPLDLNYAARLLPRDCPGGEIRKHNGRPLVCVNTNGRGYGYKKTDVDADKEKQRQSSELVVFGVFEVGWYDYILEYRFTDDGQITPRLGATGSLASDRTSAKHGWPIGRGNTHYSPNHFHNAFWRADFDLQGPAGDKVEQFDFSGQGALKRTILRKTLTRETAVKLAPDRFWRVVDPAVKNADGHPISWQISDIASSQFRGPASAGEQFTLSDLYVTQRKACERLAAQNEEPRCAKQVDKFVNGQALTDPIVWVSVDFHHIPRDEDHDPLPAHWQGFTISPRDVTAKNPY
ncbi:copper amine oxidase [Actinomadura graeca]|uniref:copper amine oxidase n=1 Tax=Actinomadura graeca TaxID=2750812 RepID=UPI001E43160D|nr:copper amine oxidase [Actinomadura graeca]